MMSSWVQPATRPASRANQPILPSQLPAAAAGLPPVSLRLLEQLLALDLFPGETLEAFLQNHLDRLPRLRTEVEFGQALVADGLLTPFQLERVLAGQLHGLVLGSYRVLEQIGSGGMGQVYLAEHRMLRRRVAVKVLQVDDNCPPAMRQRFYAEMRVLAELNHPNIVLALDAGEVAPPGPNLPLLTYLVMEWVSGGDLSAHVKEQGIAPIAQACDWIRQAAQGLQAAHDRHIIHRDIKPSNLLLTGQGQVKVVDFGLARHFCSQLTDPRALLGSLEFMPPEQSLDPSAVGPEADIYGLGASLFWLLTGQPPYPYQVSVGAAMRALQREQPRRLRQLRADAPAELDELVARLLNRDPRRRMQPPLAVSTALAPFTLPAGEGVPALPRITSGSREVLLNALTGGDQPRPQALIVAGEAEQRRGGRVAAELAGCQCDEASDAQAALDVVQANACDVVVLDLPESCGPELYRQLRERSLRPGIALIVLASAEELARGFAGDADDCLFRQAEPGLLRSRIEHALRIKAGERRAWALAEHLQRVTGQLEQSLAAREADLRQAHNALLFTLAKVAESREGESPGHQRRLQRYVRVLAQEAARMSPWSGMVTEAFLEQLERCVPLHDIGKLGLPDDILQKPGPLSPTERVLVETHPIVGDRILEALAREHGGSLEFLRIARAIVRHHHERFDGTGYPDRLVGEAIPPAARLVALADVYDTVRRQRLYKPAMSHVHAVQAISARGQFDPVLVWAFQNVQEQFEKIYREVGD